MQSNKRTYKTYKTWPLLCRCCEERSGERTRNEKKKMIQEGLDEYYAEVARREVRGEMGDRR